MLKACAIYLHKMVALLPVKVSQQAITWPYISLGSLTFKGEGSQSGTSLSGRVGIMAVVAMPWNVNEELSYYRL